MHTTLLDIATISSGLLVALLVIGLLMAAHGSQKLLGWFGGHGIAGTGTFFEAFGFRPGRLFATVAAVTEMVSGILVALLGLQSLYTPTLALAALAIGVVGGVGNLLARRPVVAA